MMRLYERTFRLSGYEVELANDGEEALAKLRKIESAPTLMLCDVMMPKMNGFDVLRELKKDKKLKNMPVVMLTNLAGQADAEKALELGAVLYLVKSQYDPKEVVEKVKEIIAGYTRDKSVPEVKVPGKKLSKEKG